MVDIWKVRQEFPILKQHMHGKPFVYLDSAATSQKPRCMIDAMHRFYAESYGTVHRSVYDFTRRQPLAITMSGRK